MVIDDPRLGSLTLSCPRRSSSGQKQLWLTFDDGPGPDTDAVLDILERFEAPATFFLIGEKVGAYSDLERLKARLKAGGHKVGNHSWSHPNFLLMGSEPTKTEIEQTQHELSQHFSDELLPIFRPPYGYRTESLFSHLQAAQLSVVGWSVNSLDFLSGSVSKVVKRVLEQTQPGSILLFHDGPQRRTRTLKALPSILSDLKAQGYTFAVPHLEDVR
jgi:peptidoglycan/xylan/chitin deacetylase (PgdA/CDA1 family)